MTSRPRKPKPATREEKVADLLAIPEFLRVANRGKGIKLPPDVVVRVLPPSRKAEVEIDYLAHLSPEDRRVIEDKIAKKEIMRHWLSDPGTIHMALVLHRERSDRKAESLARLKALPKPERAPARPAFGVGIKFRLNVKENPRRAGSRGHKVYAAMAEWKKKNPAGTVAELLAAAPEGYNKTDYMWDLEHEHIKSDV